MGRKIFLFVILLFFIVLVYASTGVLDKPDYKLGEIAIFEMTITAGNEKSRAYTVNWTNATGWQIELDSGTTPSSTTPPLNEFFEEFLIPTNYITLYGNNLTANLTGTNLDESESSTVSVVGVNDLIIESINVTSPNFMGKNLGISAKVTNSSDGVVGAICEIDIETIDGLSIVTGPEFLSQSGGDIDQNFFIDSNVFDKGTQYLADINCFCDSGQNTGCYSGVNNITNADGDAKKSFLIKDLGTSMVNDKWYNDTDFTSDFVTGDYPAVWLENSLEGKVEIVDGPARLNQDAVNWTLFNNTILGNSSLNGEGFVFAGRPASLCLLINNSFSEEKFITINQVSFDDDTLEQHFFPLNIDTLEQIDPEENIMRTSIKPSETDGILQRCSEEFIIPDHVFGGNDIDINFHLHVEGFEQAIELESDEFSLYGQKLNESFVPIIDIQNISTTGIAIYNACTKIDVVMEYNFFGSDEETFFAEYCFENTDKDVLRGCFVKEISADRGENKVINDTLKIPYFETTGQAEVTISIFPTEEKISLDDRIGFGDFEPSNTFNVTKNSSLSCLYSQNLDQETQYLQFRELEEISNKTGTFRTSIICPSTADRGSNIRCQLRATLEDPQLVQEETGFTCFIEQDSIKYSQIKFQSP